MERALYLIQKLPGKVKYLLCEDSGSEVEFGNSSRVEALLTYAVEPYGEKDAVELPIGMDNFLETIRDLW